MMKFLRFQKKIKNVLVSRWFLALFLAIGFLAISETIHFFYKQRQEIIIENRAISYGYEVALSFERELNKLIYISRGLEGYLKTHYKNIDSDDLESILKEMQAGDTKLIRNFGIAENYILKWVYPLDGNENALGLDYTKIPEQYPKIRAAINDKKGTLDGPINLVQGGIGLIYRSPVFINDQYWGLISTVLNLDNLCIQAFSQTKSDEFVFSVSTTLRADERDIIYGSSSLFNAADVKVINLLIPNNQWYIAVTPKHHRNQLLWVTYLRWTGIILSLMIFFFIFFFRTLQVKRNDLLKKYKVLSEKSSDLVWVIDFKSRQFEYFSPSIDKLFGYTADQVQKLGIKHFFTNASYEKLLNVLPKRYMEFNRTNDTNKTYIDQLKHVKKDGTTFWVETTTHFNFGPNNKIELIGVSRDINSRKEAEIALIESEQKFKAIFDYANDGYLLLDPETKEIVMCNKEMSTLVGYEKDELLHKHISYILKEHIDFENKLRINETVFREKIYTEHYPLIKKDQSSFYADIRSSEVLLDNHRFLLCSFRDITKNLELQNELIRLNDEKDRFISILAHDLKSPFNGFIGLLELLINDFDILEKQEIVKILNHCLDTSNNIYQLFDELLLWSRSQSQKLEKNPELFNFKSLIKQVIEIQQYNIDKKKIKVELDFERDLCIFTDLEIMKIVMRNLISNAIKFSNPESTIHIKAIEEASEYQIFVIDEGLGMDETTLINLWQNNKNKSKPGTDNEKGSGFGLLLVKELIEKLGGEIYAESKLGLGSVFTIKLLK